MEYALSAVRCQRCTWGTGFCICHQLGFGVSSSTSLASSYATVTVTTISGGNITVANYGPSQPYIELAGPTLAVPTPCWPDGSAHYRVGALASPRRRAPVPREEPRPWTASRAAFARRRRQRYRRPARRREATRRVLAAGGLKAADAEEARHLARPALLPASCAAPSAT